MKTLQRILFVITICATTFFCASQAFSSNFFTHDEEAKEGNELFDTTLYNAEEELSIFLDFSNQAITIPGQEVFGEMAGYFKTNYDSRYWMITSAAIDKKGRTVTLEIINDYGSEDLTATLTFNPKDSTYTFRQSQGATIKFAKNRKWHKIPKEMIFKRK